MDDIPVSINPKSKRFIPQLRSFIRQQGLAYSTEKTYVHWIKYYIRFHKFKHPADMNETEMDEFLTFLAVERNVAPGTQRTALNLIFRGVMEKYIYPMPCQESIRMQRRS